MRKLLLLVLVVGLLWSVNADWVERLKIQTVDYDMNPISDFKAKVVYQKNLATGIDGKIECITDYTGTCTVDLRNFVPSYTGNENKVYTITVVGAYGLGSEERKTKYGDNRIDGVHLEQFRFNTTAVTLTVYVKDQKKQPIENASVNVGGYSHLTDENGVAKFSMPQSKYSVTVSKSGFSKTASVTMDGDTTTDITLLIYDNTLKVTVVDEYGVSIAGAQLFFADMQTESDDNGDAEFTGIKVSEGKLIARYEGIERNIDIIFIDDTLSKTIVFPSSPLIIDNIEIRTLDPHEDNCTILLKCRARDERVALSKISVNLIYSKNGGEWNSISQKNELGVFEFEVGCEAPLDFSYMFTASNEYGSVQTAVYNMSLTQPAECNDRDTKSCITSDGCAGRRTCVQGQWGGCADVPDDGCPLVIGPNGNQTDGSSIFDQIWKILLGTELPEGLDVGVVALALVGSLALIGAVGILALTKRELLISLFERVKNVIKAAGSLDKTLDRADKEYKREKVSDKFMKEGKTDDFFGDEEDK